MDKKQLDLKRLNQYGNLFDVSERKILISEMLKVLRKEFDLSQIEIAKHIGIKPGTYSTYENGTREIPAEILVRISLLYDIPTDILLQRDRLTKGEFEAQRQIEALNEDFEFIKQMVYDKESELNPQFAELLKSMTDAFGALKEQITDK